MTPRKTGYKIIRSLHGDTLQRIALRELGDASLWPDIAYMNGLAPPYLTDDADEANTRVLLTGSRMLVPVAAPVAFSDVSPVEPYGTDVWLNRGALVAANGDFALVAGVSNLEQALGHVVITEPGELLFHPRYGCGLRRYLGTSNSRANGIVAGSLVKRALKADPRVAAVASATVEMSGVTQRIEATVVAVDGSNIGVTA